MPRLVNYGGKVHSFPDGTTDDEVAAALESSEKPQGSAWSGLRGASSIGAPHALERTGSAFDALTSTSPANAIFNPIGAMVGATGLRDKVRALVARLPFGEALTEGSISDQIQAAPQAGALAAGAVGSMAGPPAGIAAAGAGASLGTLIKNALNLGTGIGRVPETEGAAVMEALRNTARGAGEQAIGEGAGRLLAAGGRAMFPIPKSAAEFTAAGKPELAMARDLGMPVMEGRGRPLDTPSAGVLSNLFERRQEKKILEAARGKFNDIGGRAGLAPVETVASKGDLQKQIATRLKESNQASQLRAGQVAEATAAIKKELEALGLKEGQDIAGTGRKVIDTIEGRRKAAKGIIGPQIDDAEKAFGPKTKLDPTEAIKSLKELDASPARDYAIARLSGKASAGHRPHGKPKSVILDAAGNPATASTAATKPQVSFERFREVSRLSGSKLAQKYGAEGLRDANMREVRTRVEAALRKQMEQAEGKSGAAKAYTDVMDRYRGPEYAGTFRNQTVKKFFKDDAAPEIVFSIPPRSTEKLSRLVSAAGPEGIQSVREGFLNANILKGGLQKLPNNLGKWSDEALDTVFGAETRATLRGMADKVRAAQVGGKSAGVDGELATLQRVLGAWRQPTYNAVAPARFNPLTAPFTEIPALTRTLSAYGRPTAKAGSAVVNAAASLSKRLPLSLDYLTTLENAKKEREKRVSR